jgi:hypothetical protein
MTLNLLIVFLVIACGGTLLSRSRGNSQKRQWERRIRECERDRKKMIKQ